MPLIQHVYPWDSQPQAAVEASNDSFKVIAAAIPAVSLFDTAAGYALTFGGAAPTADYQQLASGERMVNIHPSGGASGIASIRWNSELIKNTDNEFLIVWRGIAKSLSTANGYAFARGGDSGGGGWSLYVRFNSATALEAAIVTTSPSVVGYSAIVTDSFNIVDMETVALRVSGGELSLFHQRSRKKTSTAIGVNLRGTSASVLRFGGSAGNESAGNNFSSAMFVVSGPVSDSSVWDILDNPWQLFASRTQYIPTASGVLVPTLSLSTFVPGSLTATGWRPQVTTE